LGIAVVSGFHTNFQHYSSIYGLGVFTRLLTQYLRWFHNRSALTLVPSASQRLELQRRHFDRLELLERGVDSRLFSPAKRQSALRQSWGLGEDDIAL
ncbi:glycosyltransferase, partial [Pseudomonas sp. FSL R10-0071]